MKRFSRTDFVELPRLTDDFFQLKIRDTNRPFFILLNVRNKASFIFHAALMPSIAIAKHSNLVSNVVPTERRPQIFKVASLINIPCNHIALQKVWHSPRKIDSFLFQVFYGNQLLFSFAPAQFSLHEDPQIALLSHFLIF